MTPFPFYHQHDTMQCGITCLRMICKYYGKEYSIESLSSLHYSYGCVVE
ncbi:C39 family peptidase [Parabacteroides distasonis]|nr:C39 family peptidase [Parabacteroides distasonis]